MDAIVQSAASWESELTAIARLVIYAQTAARDLGAKDVEHHLANTLDAIVRELQGASDDADMQIVTSPLPVTATCQ
ncbi:hypothetical protein [Rhizobium sp. LjRoot254]|uniref:hypothetical protein n=1 Tax=Rhizobium sp. LjRoot254 TaxID=3342297 RepID=UPI003ECC5FD0